MFVTHTTTHTMVVIRTVVLERARIERGVSRTAFGEACKISTVSRTRIFRGEPVALSVVRKVARYLRVRPATLYDVDAALPDDSATDHIDNGAEFEGRLV